MNKSKKIFIALAVLVAIVCVACFFLLRPKADNKPSETTTPTAEQAEQPEPTEAPTSTQELTTATESVDESDEEVDWAAKGYGDPYFSLEGKVYRNDKTLSIDIPMEADGVTHTFTFGYVSNRLNKYLYLNPHCADATPDKKYGYIFSAKEGSTVSSFVYDDGLAEQHVAEQAGVCLGRTYDVQSPAEYNGPKDPGAIWYSPAGLTAYNPDSWVDVRVIELDSYRLIATMRIHIRKDTDGTYSMTGIENKNLLQVNDESQVTNLGVETALHIAMDKLRSGDIILLATDELDLTHFTVEWRDYETKLYYPYVRPTIDGSQPVGGDSLYFPCLAVTYNAGYRGFGLITLYVAEIQGATTTDPGMYEVWYYDFLTPFSQDKIQDTKYFA